MTKRLLSQIKWLTPGMGIKRWLLLSLAGIMILAFGLALISSTVQRAAMLSELYLTEKCLELTGCRPSSFFVDALLILLGLLIVFVAGYRVFAILNNASAPNRDKQIVDLLYERRRLSNGPKIVVIGGGTGLSTLLRGLKHYTSNIAAIVSVSDDGGSSGRLSKEMHILPPGDIRHCLTALADDESLLSDLFDYRFHEGAELNGHSFGNLFLAALNRVCHDDFQEAVSKAGQILNIRGWVLPVTLESSTLCASLQDGRIVKGESDIPLAQGRIERVFLEPEYCATTDAVLQVIAGADLIVLGPGSLYTSVMPNLLIDGVVEALRQSEAPKVYICNVMSQPGETDGYKASDHLQAIYNHTGPGLIDYILVNTKKPSLLARKYSDEGALPVEADFENLKGMVTEVIPCEMMAEKEQVRHDPMLLGQAIARLADKLRNEVYDSYTD